MDKKNSHDSNINNKKVYKKITDFMPKQSINNGSWDIMRKQSVNEIPSDVMGSYTGTPADGGKPVQDSDDI